MILRRFLPSIAIFSQVLHPGTITINFQQEMYNTLPHSQEIIIERLEKALMPLLESIEKTLGTDQVEVSLDFQSWEGAQIYYVHIHTHPACLSIRCHCDALTEKMFFIDRLDVDYPHQRKGVGRACLEFLCNKDVAHTLGYTYVKLDSVKSARHFYQKLGFTSLYADDEQRGLYPYSRDIAG